MVKQIFLLVSLSILLFSCCYNGVVSEYGLPRREITKFKDESKVIYDIDTMVIYKLDANFFYNKSLQKYSYYKKVNSNSQIFYKFYSKGKLGYFRIRNEEVLKKDKNLFNPKKAEMGYYSEYEKGKLKLKFTTVFDCTFHIEEYEGYIESDSIVLYDMNKHGFVYKKDSISKTLLNGWKPDW